MNKFLVIVVGLVSLSFAGEAQAEDTLAGVPELQNENTIVIVVPNTIPFDTLVLRSPLDQYGGDGWQNYIQVESPQKLVELQKQYGGLLYASARDLCSEPSSPSGLLYKIYPIHYGLVGAIIGNTGVNFSANASLDELIEPRVKEKEEKGKHLRSCTLVGNDTVVIQFYQGIR
jgi:hypothetical protein